MKKIKFKSLAMRIWATFIAIILIFICIISFLYLIAFKIIWETSKIQNLKFAHEVLIESNHLRDPSGFEKIKNIKDIEHFIVKVDSNNNYNIINIGKREQGKVVDDKEAIPLTEFVSPETKRWMATFIGVNSTREGEFIEFYNNKKYIFIISSIENQVAEKAYLISYIRDVKENLLIYVVMITGIIFIAIGFLTAKVVANYISKPLKELEDYTVKIANKEWEDPIKVKSEDEIGRLVDAMNRMQKHLKKVDEEEKMFLQSISHDLKTPVMVIMSHAEAIVDGIYVESVEKTAEIIRDEARSLEKKIKQLLYLNTLAYSLENSKEIKNFDLCELMISIINRFEPINDKITWNLDLDNVFIYGNEEKMQVAMENIIENGLRYAKEEMSISIKDEKSHIILDIYNDGPKISEKHINHIFENLYKDKTGNFGLGLAIAKKIIDFHNGEIKVVNRELGVSFIIKLKHVNMA